MYLVLATTSTSMPSSFRLVSVKGIKVESATTGTPFRWAISVMACKSATSNCGLVSTSRNTQHVFSSTAFSTASVLVRSVSRGSTPNRVNVLLIRARVLPNKWCDDTMLLSFSQSDNRVLPMAAIPELKAVTCSAPVSALTRCSNCVTVGFSTRA